MARGPCHREHSYQVSGKVDLSRYDWRTVLTIATAAMLIQQAFSYVCQIAMPILADRLAEEFGISRGWLGFYLALQNVIAILAAIGCGGFILRYGPLRVSQAALVMMGAAWSSLPPGNSGYFRLALCSWGPRLYPHQPVPIFWPVFARLNWHPWYFL